VRDLIGQALGHEACANDAHPDGAALILTPPQRGIDEQHMFLLS
jgi:hypothetical protein